MTGDDDNAFIVDWQAAAVRAQAEAKLSAARHDGENEDLTREGVRKRKFAVECLVADAIRHLQRTFGISLSDWPDDSLAEHNALVSSTWRQLDRLSLWAGGRPEYNQRPADRRRGEFIAACNSLYAELDCGAHVAAVEITAHNADGTEVSYMTVPGAKTIGRIIHTENHDGCADATISDEQEGQ